MAKNQTQDVNFAPLIGGWLALTVVLSLAPAVLYECALETPNSPYRAEDNAKNYYYSTFREPPKHLDPAVSYSADEYNFIAQIYEPPFQYHYLKRPYELEPLTLAGMPEVKYLDKDGKPLPEGADPSQTAKSVYTLKIKSGIRYQPHPAFARKADGSLKYHDLAKTLGSDAGSIRDINDPRLAVTPKDAIELSAKHYALQFRRMADPRLHCPIASIWAEKIDGFKEYAGELRGTIETQRQARRDKATAEGRTYKRDQDERANPLDVDYNAFKMAGVVALDDTTLQITIKGRYPQILYWMAMPFASPIPQEVIDFYSQGPLIENNVTLDRYPVGTGPFRIETFQPNKEIILARNENYHEDLYPSQGATGDKEAGLLADAGQKMPFVDRAVYKLEKEAIPRWNKFLQGYYDISGITEEAFDQALSGGSMEDLTVSDDMTAKGIDLLTSVQTSIYYYGFNMKDDVVGGLDPKKAKLRQAISIALDNDAYIKKFLNGRGLPAMGPIPPGIYGYKEGKAGINDQLYDWDEASKTHVIKGMAHARKLVEEAGYPGGLTPDGTPLVINYDTAASGQRSQDTQRWMARQLEQIGLSLNVRATDYNRFREKVMQGNIQMISWGWNADYPDPENFLFLLYGPNGKVEHHGENAINYANPEFDKLFRQMETMPNTPEREKIIAQMVELLRKDAPWHFNLNPKAFTLLHDWVKNQKPNAMANNTLKYLRIDPKLRAEKRSEWNKPIWWPASALIALFFLGSLPAIISLRKKQLGLI